MLRRLVTERTGEATLVSRSLSFRGSSFLLMLYLFLGGWLADLVDIKTVDSTGDGRAT
jgi:hypothetical protein